MKNVKLFCDGSVNPQKKIGYGAYFIYTEIDTLNSAKEKIQTKKFIDTSSTKLELEVLLWALEDTTLLDKKICIYTDCQNILGLEDRRKRLETNNYKSAKGKILNNHELYKEFFVKTDKLNCTFIKVKGHKPSQSKDLIDDLFTLVDRGSRDALRKEKI
jgi:ribonuclease HI